MTLETPTPAATAADAADVDTKVSRRTRMGRLTGTDRVVVALFVVVPSLFVVLLVWLPALASIVLSFTNWNGIGDVADDRVHRHARTTRT